MLAYAVSHTIGDGAPVHRAFKHSIRPNIPDETSDLDEIANDESVEESSSKEKYVVHKRVDEDDDVDLASLLKLTKRVSAKPDDPPLNREQLKLCAQYNVVVKRSTIPNSGWGLFTTVTIKSSKEKSYPIVPYDGVLLSKLHGGPYVIVFPGGTWVDAADFYAGVGRFANCVRPWLNKVGDNNAHFYYVTSPQSMRRGWIGLNKGKTLLAGSEIFVSYGDMYGWPPLSPEEQEMVDRRRKQALERKIALAASAPIKLYAGYIFPKNAVESETSVPYPLPLRGTTENDVSTDLSLASAVASSSATSFSSPPLLPLEEQLRTHGYVYCRGFFSDAFCAAASAAPISTTHTSHLVATALKETTNWIVAAVAPGSKRTIATCVASELLVLKHTEYKRLRVDESLYPEADARALFATFYIPLTSCAPHTGGLLLADGSHASVTAMTTSFNTMNRKVRIETLKWHGSAYSLGDAVLLHPRMLYTLSKSVDPDVTRVFLMLRIKIV